MIQSPKAMDARVGDLHLGTPGDVEVAKISGKDIGPGLDFKDPPYSIDTYWYLDAVLEVGGEE